MIALEHLTFNRDRYFQALLDMKYTKKFHKIKIDEMEYFMKSIVKYP